MTRGVRHKVPEPSTARQSARSEVLDLFLGWETGGVGSMGMLSTPPAWHSVPRNYCAMHRVLAWGKMCRAGWLGVWGAHCVASLAASIKTA